MGGRLAIATAALASIASVVALAADAQAPVASLRIGQSTTFRAGQIPAGATIACAGHGKRVVLTVPDHRTIPRIGASSMKMTWVRGLHLTLSSNGHGTFFASCL